MSCLKELNEQNLQEILEGIYKRGQEVENISVKELIEEIQKLFQGYISK
ncbi:hypothetical protein [Metabacillus bambusae]|uniref:Uncharacterized protein n=1 Tax=Metabacillus bambusae TaxID=2795218 RepID=A0ABS3N242_9BACI|nr:hypothetical protein [Metabacillus bambusae]MBO1512356.1 hypothetical protein [Metabacillus bambusae]